MWVLQITSVLICIPLIISDVVSASKGSADVLSIWMLCSREHVNSGLVAWKLLTENEIGGWNDIKVGVCHRIPDLVEIVGGCCMPGNDHQLGVGVVRGFGYLCIHWWGTWIISTNITLSKCLISLADSFFFLESKIIDPFYTSEKHYLEMWKWWEFWVKMALF